MSRIVIQIDLPAYGGFFIGRHEGKVVMIKGAVLPGETVEAIIEREKRDYLIATAVNILEPSPYRIEPPCKYFGKCGGCQLQYISYDRQVAIKEEILRDSLKRLAKTDIDLSEPLFHKDPWNYRLRGQFKVFQGSMGFYRENSREVVDIDRCPLMTEEINSLLLKIKPVVKDSDIKEVHITAGDCSTALLKLSSRIRSRSDISTLSSMFREMDFSGIWIETSDKKIYRHGKTYVTLNLQGLKYSISPMTFFQSHWRLNQRVVEFLKNGLEPLKGKRVLDMYAGAGNFSIPLAMDAEIVAIEENPYAVEDGQRNLKNNSIKNCRFIISSAENYHIKEDVDIVILDPPRPGLSNRVLSKVLSILPEKIAYVSCNPSTFARDLKKLQLKYDIESLRVIDFFPQTFHIESLVLLGLR